MRGGGAREGAERVIGVSECTLRMHVEQSTSGVVCMGQKTSRDGKVLGKERSSMQGWGVGDAVTLRKHVPPAADVQRPDKLAQHFESAGTSFAQTRQHVAAAAPPRHR